MVKIASPKTTKTKKVAGGPPPAPRKTAPVRKAPSAAAKGKKEKAPVTPKKTSKAGKLHHVFLLIHSH